jgi:hypothetical protein
LLLKNANYGLYSVFGRPNSADLPGSRAGLAVRLPPLRSSKVSLNRCDCIGAGVQESLF